MQNVWPFVVYFGMNNSQELVYFQLIGEGGVNIVCLFLINVMSRVLTEMGFDKAHCGLVIPLWKSASF